MKKKPARSLPNIIWKCFRQIFNQEKWSGKLLEASDPVFSTKKLKIAMDSMDKRMKREEGGSKWPTKQSNHSQTSKQRQPTTFQWTETVGDVPGSLWPSFGKSKNLAILECENGLFNFVWDFLKIYSWIKLFCAILPNMMAKSGQKDRTQKITQQKLPFEISALLA